MSAPTSSTAATIATATITHHGNDVGLAGAGGDADTVKVKVGPNPPSMVVIVIGPAADTGTWKGQLNPPFVFVVPEQRVADVPQLTT